MLQIKVLPPFFGKSIVAESRAEIICFLDCYIEFLHPGGEVVNLCSRFRVPESRVVMMNNVPTMLLAICLPVLAVCLNGNCRGHIL